MTWQPPTTILTPSDRVTRKHIKCLYPKVEKPVLKKKKCKISKVKEVLAVKNLVCFLYLVLNYLVLLI